MGATIALGLIQSLPGIIAAIQSIRGTLGATDQATVDAALAEAMASAGVDVAKAVSDLNAAS